MRGFVAVFAVLAVSALSVEGYFNTNLLPTLSPATRTVPTATTTPTAPTAPTAPIAQPTPSNSSATPRQALGLEAFISYRRVPTRNLAMLLKVLLERENVTVFLDVEDLRGGGWEQQLMDGIAEAPNFILVLGNGTLDRTKGDDNYEDTLHKEIRNAVCAEKRIVLVFDDFNFPPATDYSEEIQAALENQGLTWNHALVDQSLERLITYMRDPAPLTPNQSSSLSSIKTRYPNACEAA